MAEQGSIRGTEEEKRDIKKEGGQGEVKKGEGRKKRVLGEDSFFLWMKNGWLGEKECELGCGWREKEERRRGMAENGGKGEGK